MSTVLLVCGGRDYNNYERMKTILDHLAPNAIVHGCAKGADQMAGNYARARGIPEIRVPANWDFYEKPAGVFRNDWMLKFVKVTKVVAFPGGKGTADMVRKAKFEGFDVLEIEP